MWSALSRSLGNSPLCRRLSPQSITTALMSSLTALSPAEFRAFRVTKVETISHDTKHIVFALPTPEHEMGLTVASCLVAKASINGEDVVRPYTPVNLNSKKGVLELVVKGYPTGKLSKHIVELQVGDSLEMKGPFPKFPYKPNQYKRIGLIAGGSGVTPSFQVIKEALQNPEDTTELVLIFANNTEADILLREELDSLAASHAARFQVHYVLREAPSEKSWDGYTGFVTKELIEKLLPGPSDEHLVCVCGPPPMMEAISGDKAPDKTQGELAGVLKELGYSPAQVFKF